MKRRLLIAAIFCSAVLSSSCERDDICSEATPVTPRLSIQFFDYNAPAVLKNVTGLKVREITSDNELVFNSVSEIKLPLQTAQDSVTFEMTLNSSSLNPDLIYTDRLSFQYTRDNVYISRACGYKTVFALTPDASGAAVLPDDDSDWIRTIVVANYNIEHENETHLRIYF